MSSYSLKIPEDTSVHLSSGSIQFHTELNHLVHTFIWSNNFIYFVELVDCIDFYNQDKVQPYNTHKSIFDGLMS